MHLDGDFTKVKFRSHLFVPKPRNHESHYFALPGSKAFEAPPQLGNTGLFLARRAISIECLMNGGEKFVLLKRLRQEFARARCYCSRRHGNVAVRGDKNDRNAAPRLRQLLLKFQTAHARKSYIQHEATRDGRPRYIEKFFRGSKTFRVQPPR